jgi:hypothetical protein
MTSSASSRDAPEEADDLLLMCCHMSEDFREGVSAFLEAQPNWQGR